MIVVFDGFCAVLPSIHSLDPRSIVTMATIIGEHEQTSAVMVESRQAAADAARRERSEARRLRVLDARNRTIGVS